MGNTKKLPPIMMTEEIVEALNEEFEYQSTLQGSGRADAREHGVEGQLVTLQAYTQQAMIDWAKNAGDEAALETLRKVAAIACRALIQYGCPRRKPPLEASKD